MKKSKKIVALLMALVMCLGCSTSAFAADSPEIEKHTITIELDGSESTGIQPLMWDQGNWDVSNTTYTTSFTIPDRYFAFEMKATDLNGNAISGNYNVSLMYTITASIHSESHSVDGKTYKADWIDVNAGSSYLFKIINYASSKIKVSITYYSWA